MQAQDVDVARFSLLKVTFVLIEYKLEQFLAHQSYVLAYALVYALGGRQSTMMASENLSLQEQLFCGEETNRSGTITTSHSSRHY